MSPSTSGNMRSPSTVGAGGGGHQPPTSADACATITQCLMIYHTVKENTFYISNLVIFISSF